MELYFFFAAALLLAIPAVFFLLAAQAHRGPSFASGLLALFYLISALCSLAGYGLGWLGELIVKRRDEK